MPQGPAGWLFRQGFSAPIPVAGAINLPHLIIYWMKQGLPGRLFAVSLWSAWVFQRNPARMVGRLILALGVLVSLPLVATPQGTLGTVWRDSTPKYPLPSARENHASIGFKGRFWVIGGIADGRSVGDVWHTENGIDWTQAKNHAEFGARSGHAAFVFRDRIWISGGATQDSKFLADLWSSADGENWTKESDSSFPPRAHHTIIPYGELLWMVGGNDGWNRTDVWSSVDGVQWRQQSWGQFPSRSGHASVVFDGRLWILGGSLHQAICDAWSTADGVAWVEEGDVGALPASRPGVFVRDGRMWVVAGNGTVASSVDGRAWVTETSGIFGGSRWNAPLAMVDGTAWTFGGRQFNPSRLGNTTWKSQEGADWTQITHPAYQPRAGHATLNFANRLWIIGNPDVWSTGDGVTWQLHDGDSFPDRAGFSTAVFDGRMWVIGGSDSTGVLNDVWSSTDGETWIQETEAAGFSPRWRHSSAVHSGRLWVIGGTTTGADFLRDVWSSADGVNWEEVNAAAPFTGRHSHSSFTFDNKMWVVGGTVYDSSLNSYGNVFVGPFSSHTIGKSAEVWSSIDGIAWSLVSTAPFAARGRHASVIHEGRIWVACGLETYLHFQCYRMVQHPFGGEFYCSSYHYYYAERPIADVWSSSDGNTWRQEATTSPLGNTSSHSAASFGGALWLVGWNTAWTTGAGPYAVASPSPLDFGIVEDDGGPTTRTITLSNPMPRAWEPLVISAAEISGEGAAPFALGVDADLSPIPVGGERTLDVVVHPAALGPLNANLLLHTNQPTTPTLSIVLRALVADTDPSGWLFR